MRKSGGAITIVTAWVWLLMPNTAAEAQMIEGRVDAITNNPSAIHAGAGFTVPLGTYVRSGMEAAIGASEHGISGRIDFINRFQLDPFRQHKWAPYAGGGLTARLDDNRPNRAYLLVFAGVDGPELRGAGIAFEAGLGGGGRIGMIVRHTTAERR